MRLAFTTLVITAAVASASAQRMSTPRTPWGDPDLQGTYTNTFENGTAFERPDQFSGRKLEDVNGEELKKMRPGSMLPAIYGNQYEIVQAPGYVAIRYEMIHETRIIPLDRRPRLGGAIQNDMGDARGWWEGDTLFIETTNFKERSVYRNANPEKLKVTERFSRISPEQIRWIVTVDDPTTWTRPWTFSMPLTVDNNPVPSYECHEGNYGLRNILSAARAEERQRAR